MAVRRTLKTSRYDMPTFTGRTKQMISPLTGQLQTYLESYQMHITSPAPNIPDLEAIKTKVNADCLTQNVDSFCDGIFLVQGAIEDTYKMRHWVADAQPTLALTHPELLQYQRVGVKPLIAGIDDAVLLAIVIIIALAVAAIVAIAVVNSWFNSAMAVLRDLMPGKPAYVAIDPNDPTKSVTYDDVAAYQSGQNLLYWYVCPQCYAGYGLKSSYPKVTDVPASEKAAFDEHASICQGIPKTDYSYVPMFVWAIIGVGAGITVLYILMKAFTSKTTERIVERAPRYR